VRGAGFKYGYLDIRKDRIIEIMDRDSPDEIGFDGHVARDHCIILR